MQIFSLIYMMRVLYIAIFIVCLSASCSRHSDIVYSGGIAVSDAYEVSGTVVNDSYLFNFPRNIFCWIHS